MFRYSAVVFVATSQLLFAQASDDTDRSTLRYDAVVLLKPRIGVLRKSIDDISIASTIKEVLTKTPGLQFIVLEHANGKTTMFWNVGTPQLHAIQIAERDFSHITSTAGVEPRASQGNHPIAVGENPLVLTRPLIGKLRRLLVSGGATGLSGKTKSIVANTPGLELILLQFGAQGPELLWNTGGQYFNHHRLEANEYTLITQKLRS